MSDVDPRDLYSSKLMRRTLPSTINKSRTSQVAKFLAAFGEADNAIGGLFGDADFLPNNAEASLPDPLTEA